MESTASIIEEAVRPLRRRVEALEDALRGAELADGHNLRRAELAEKRLEKMTAERGELVRQLNAARRDQYDTLRKLDDLENVYHDTHTERDMAEAAYDQLAADVRRLRQELEARQGAAQDASSGHTSWNLYYQGRAQAYTVALEKLDRIL